MTTLTGHKTYEIEVYDEDLDGDTKTFVQWCQDILADIPEQDRATAEIDTHGGEYSHYVRVFYQHYETDAELLVRLQREEAELANQEAWRVTAEAIHRTNEIATLKALQAKYPSVTP